MSECTANACYCGKNPPCWDHTERDFLREVERRAGASREEMLAEIAEFERYAYPLKEKLPAWLRRILGERS